MAVGTGDGGGGKDVKHDMSLISAIFLIWLVFD